MTTTTTANKFTDTVGTVKHAVTSWAIGLPSEVWLVAFLVTVALLLVAVAVGRRAAYRLGQHRAGISPGQGNDDNDDDNDDNDDKRLDKRRDKQLLAATIIPAALFWIAVLIGSGRGLTGFGEDTLHWHHGWQILVPATLDGVAVTFAFLAFRALWKKRNPDRARRIVWGATASSAFLNFAHELIKPDGAILGALYLGILSIFCMALLDEFLRQFEEGAGYIKREKPVFGLRWITLAYPTLCAWLAWTNYPPELPAPTFDTDGREIPAPITVGMAIAHLDRVRTKKAEQRNERDARRSTLPTWTRLAPWVRARKLQAILDRTLRTSTAERRVLEDNLRSEMERRVAAASTSASNQLAEAEARMEQLRRSMEATTERRLTEVSTSTSTALTEAEDRMEELARRLAEATGRADAAEQARRAEAEASARVAGQLEAVLQEKGGASKAVAELRRRESELQEKAARASGALEAERARVTEASRVTSDLQAALAEAEATSTSALHRMQDLDRRVEAAERRATEAERRLEAEAASIRAEAEAEASTLRAELERMAAEGGGNVRGLHSGRPGGSTGARRTEARSSARGGVESDDTKLHRMFSLHPTIDFEWDENEARKAAGVGYSGRAVKLLGLVQNHLVECDNKSHADCFKDYAPADELSGATA